MLQPKFNKYPKPTDWNSLLLLAQQAFEEGFRAPTFNELVAKVSELVSVMGGTGIVPTVEPDTTLPSPAQPGKIMIMKAGNYTQPGGGTLTAPAKSFNVGYWDGETWSIDISIETEADLSGYTPAGGSTKTAYELDAGISMVGSTTKPFKLGYESVTTGAASQNTVNTLYVNAGFFATSASFLAKLNVHALSGGQIELVFLRKDGSVYRPASVIPLTIVSGHNTIENIPVNVEVGDSVGIKIIGGGASISRTNSAGTGRVGVQPDFTDSIPAESVEDGMSAEGARLGYTVELFYSTKTAMEDISTSVSWIGYPGKSRIGKLWDSTSAATSSSNMVPILPSLDSVIYSNAIVKTATLSTGGEDGTVSIVVFSKKGDLYREYQRHGFSTVVGRNTYDLSALDIRVSPGDIIGFLRSGDIWFRNKPGSASPDGYHTPVTELISGAYEFSFPDYPNTPPGNNNVAYDMEVELELQPDKTLAEIVFETKDSVANIEISGTTNTRGTLLHETTFGEITGDFINNGWSEVAGGISADSNGLANFIKLNKDYSIGRREYVLRVRLASNSRFLLFNKVSEMDNMPSNPQNSMVEFDVGAGIFRTYEGYGNGTSLSGVRSEEPYAFQTDRDYVVKLVIDDNEFSSRVILIDTKTGMSKEFDPVIENLLRWNDNIAFCNYSGASPVVRSLTVSTPNKKGMIVLVMGDSITAGRTPPLAPGEGYAQKIIDMLGDGDVSGRSAGTSYGVINRLRSEVAFLRPKYVMITIGTNTSPLESHLPIIISMCKGYGSIPIINNIPWRANNTLSRNAIISGVRATHGLSGCLFDTATSVDFDNISQDTEVYIVGDTTHPNAVGHEKMFRRVFIDAPELFY